MERKLVIYSDEFENIDQTKESMANKLDRIKEKLRQGFIAGEDWEIKTTMEMRTTKKE